MRDGTGLRRARKVWDGLSLRGRAMVSGPRWQQLGEKFRVLWRELDYRRFGRWGKHTLAWKAFVGDAAAVLFCVLSFWGVAQGYFELGAQSAYFEWWAAYVALGSVAIVISVVEVLGHGPEEDSGDVPAANQRPSLDFWKRIPVLVCASYALIAASHGLKSPFYGFAFLVLACSYALIEKAAWRRVVFGVFVAFELILFTSQREVPLAGLYFVAHILFGLLFATSHQWLLALTVQWLRREHRHQLREQRKPKRNAASESRLESELDAKSFAEVQEGAGAEFEASSPAQSTASTALPPWDQACAESTQETVGHELEGLLESLHLHSVVLLWAVEVAPSRLSWMDSRNQSAATGSLQLRVQNFRTRGDAKLIDTSFVPGIFAPVMHRAQRILLTQVETHRSPGYYQQAVALGDLCAVPVHDRDGVCAVLVVDRLEPLGFSNDELAKLEKSVRHLERCIAQERSFAVARHRQAQQEQLYAASMQLSQALGAQAVQAQSLEALSRLLGFDAGFILTTIEDSPDPNDLHLGAHHFRPGAYIDASWEGLLRSFGHKRFCAPEGSVLRSAIKNKVAVSPKQIADPAWGITLFDADQRALNVQSLAVLPLIFGESCVGLAVLISGKRGAFEDGALSLAKILSHQVAASLQNARLYDAMQRKATTDGLTGLTNHRCFQERLDQAVAAVDRNPQPLSLILTDIDHFKHVNDTYGHPVGDSVLRRVAGLLQKIARKNDVVARYGGEEFVILMPGSDAQCAQHFAERLREQVESTVMFSEQGSFQVTLSLGIAEYRVDARTRSELVDRADQALYFGKRSGRNCVTKWRDVKQQSVAPINASAAAC